MNLSFAGGGFQGVYYCGVVACLQKCAPHLTYDKVYGTSAGALAAAALLMPQVNENVLAEILRIAANAERTLFGSFRRMFNSSDYIYRILDKYLPVDAHLRVNGKLCISLTTFTDAENVVVSHFDSRSQLIQAIVCSCFIPLFSGILPPYFNGVRYMDGAMSNNRPYTESSAEIVTVSAFAGECDICPCDTSQQILHMNWGNNILSLSKENIRRLSGVLIPPSSETLVKICEQGFYDTLKYLYRNNYTIYPRCLAIASTYSVASKEVLQATMDVYNCPFGAGAIEEVRKIMWDEEVVPLIENCTAHIVEIVDGMVEYMDLNLDTTLQPPDNGDCKASLETASNIAMEHYSLKHCLKLLPEALKATRRVLTSTILKRLHSLLFATSTQRCTTLQRKTFEMEHCSERRNSDEKLLTLLQNGRDVEPLLSLFYINKENHIVQKAILNLDDLDTNIVPQTPSEIEINHQLEFDIEFECENLGCLQSDNEEDSTAILWENSTCDNHQLIEEIFMNTLDDEVNPEYSISHEASKALTTPTNSLLSFSYATELDQIC
uniref:Putative adiponutrin n=1 Tax=Nyssomyia neivai TaxID=330878 RepID=A0A1L8DVM7_9DIPT